jgi:hypothetical protein
MSRSSQWSNVLKQKWKSNTGLWGWLGKHSFVYLLERNIPKNAGMIVDDDDETRKAKKQQII